MAAKEVLSLDESTPRALVPQAGDTYEMPRDVNITGNLTITGTYPAGVGTGDLLADGTVPLTANWDVGAFTIRGTQFISDVAIGTAPFVVTSTTVVANLNADTVDGVEGADIIQRDGSIPLTGNWDVGAFTITGTQFISDIATGTAPFVVSSTTQVANLNAATAGNAATVTTNANLSGHVTSTGNAAILGSFTIAQLNTAVSDGTVAELGTAQEYTKTQNFNGTTLTDAANISWDASANQVCSVTLTDNRTLDNPTNMKDGATYILRVIQDAGGTNTLAYGNAYKWEGGTAPVITATGDAIDILTFVSDGTNMYGVIAQDFS